MSAAHILVVEDDESLAQWIKEYLEKQHFQVTWLSAGKDVVTTVRDMAPDLVILDLMLPDVNGDSICRQLRAFYKHPIVMMTACDDEASEVLCLELGANDYIAKPVRPRAMLARVQALLKREALPSAPNQYKVGSLTLEKNTKSALLADEVFKISNHEFDVLWLLAEQRDHAVSREQLVGQLRGIDYDGFDRSMDIRISRLRKKLDQAGAGVEIKTIWGKGYLLTAEFTA